MSQEVSSCPEKKRLLQLLAAGREAYREATARMATLSAERRYHEFRRARADAENARAAHEEIRRALAEHQAKHGC